ncbi:hypothetical protein CsSME_00043444 [Camellia sinensis var. sinensis]
MFPLLFRIATDREATVDSYAQMQGQVVVWNVVLRRQVQDWEMGQVLGLLGFLYGLRFRGAGENFMRRDCPKSKGVFSVSSFYHRITGRVGVPFP